MIKKLLTITLSLLLTISVLNSCKDKEDNKAPLILGTWAVTQFDIAISVGGIPLTSYLIDSLDFSSQEVTIAEALIKSEVNDFFENETITFKADQTYEVLNNSNLETGTWSLNNDQSTLTIAPISDQEIALAVTSLSNEVLQMELSEVIQAEEFLDTSVYGVTIVEELQVEGSFTLIKQN